MAKRPTAMGTAAARNGSFGQLVEQYYRNDSGEKWNHTGKANSLRAKPIDNSFFQGKECREELLDGCPEAAPRPRPGAMHDIQCKIGLVRP